MLVKLDTEKALYLNQFTLDKNLFNQIVIPKIKDCGNVESLCLTLKVFLNNIESIKELVGLKSLKLILTGVSEGDSSKLKDLVSQNDESLLNLSTLEFINIEKVYLVKLNEDHINFIKSQSNSLTKLVIDHLEMG